MLQIAIVEDQPKLLRTLKQALSLFEELEVIWTAKNGKEAVDKLLQLPEKPSAILMDIEMPKMNGIEATAICKQYFPEIPIVMLTVFDDDKNIFDAILAGASGYLLKGESPQKILQSLEDAIEGRLPMSPLVAIKAISFIRQELPKQNKSTITPASYNLSERELEILSYLAEGKTYPQIANQLFISKATVRNHVHKIYTKLRVKSKSEVIQMANKHQWFKNLS